MTLTYYVDPTSPPDNTFFDYGVYLTHSHVQTLIPGPTGGNIQKTTNAVQTSNGTEVSIAVPIGGWKST